MSDATLWIDEVGCTATITGTNVSYTMPLWALDVIRDIIGAEAEKKVEVTHRDFDTQQELLDRYRAENAKLSEQGARLFDKTLELKAENAKLREQGERLFDKASELGTENAKLRLLVRNLVRATHPADRAELISNAAELGIEVDG